MFWSLNFWGDLRCGQRVIPWFSLLLADRFLLGMMEAAAIMLASLRAGRHPQGGRLSRDIHLPQRDHPGHPVRPVQHRRLSSDLWLPTIIKAGSARGTGMTGLPSAVPYAFATVLMLAVSYTPDRPTASGVRVAVPVATPLQDEGVVDSQPFCLARRPTQGRAHRLPGRGRPTRGRRGRDPASPGPPHRWATWPCTWT
jgi:hypothetical protein